jgi:lipopolysaccharide/colanic/teichoic acid biosynthesis glycosyltransferase
MFEKFSVMYQQFFKRIFDVVVSIFLLIVLSPVIVITGLFVRIKLGSPILFRQERPGLKARSFTLLKFRTMLAQNPDAPLPDADRLTSFGQRLRSTSLDELPELWNVLQGQMSLVGPRPLLVEYLPLYSEAQSRRHELRPGLTGWAQVNGRNALTWGQKFELDVWYVDHCSFAFDLKILWKTLASVFTRSGISADGEATMPPFVG